MKWWWNDDDDDNKCIMNDYLYLKYLVLFLFEVNVFSGYGWWIIFVYV